jgi:hypothetical protein
MSKPPTRRRTPRLVLALFVAASFVLAGVVVPVAVSPASAAASDIETIITKTNQARTAKGLKPLVHNTRIDKVAQAWAVQMSKKGMVHNPNVGAQIPAGWNIWAENIAWNYSSQTVVQAWLNSPGHKANIMDPKATDIGVGFYVDSSGSLWAVQDFAAYKTPTAPIAAATPKITGTTKTGYALTATPGTWKPTATPSYQWYRGGTKISGANRKSYTLTAASVGKTISVRITGKKSGYVTKTVSSAATAKIYGVFTRTPVPVISGTAAVGKVLTAKSPAFSPAAGFSYQWYRGQTKISGATSKTYKLTAADRGKRISVQETGKRTAYVSVVKKSAATVAVK